MEYDLYNELVKDLGNKFEEGMQSFSSLKQYIAKRLGNFVYRDSSAQHYGTSHSIFYLTDLENNKVYQGFYDLESKILTIEPVNDVRITDNGMLIRVSGKDKEITFLEKKNDRTTVEHLKENNELLINTKIYTNHDNIFGSLEQIQFLLSENSFAPSYEFGLKKDNFSFTFNTYTATDSIQSDWHYCYPNEDNAQAIGIYLEKIGKKIENNNNIFQKKKTNRVNLQ